MHLTKINSTDLQKKIYFPPRQVCGSTLHPQTHVIFGHFNTLYTIFCLNKNSIILQEKAILLKGSPQYGFRPVHFI